MDGNMNGVQENGRRFATKAIHVGQDPSQWSHRAVIPPISMATTFHQPAPAQFTEFDYSRSGNPTRKCLEECIAALEGAKYAHCFASGLAATSTLVYLLNAGDHVICFDDVYGGTNRFFRTCAAKLGVKVSFVDATNPSNVEKAWTETTRLVWMETPSNPTMKIVDIKAVANIAKKHQNAIFVVDNTFMTPYFQKPLHLGADIVLHSLTKYMNGHSDVVMGAVAVNREDLHEKIGYLQNSIGAVPSPFDCFLVNRGLKTLHIRMERHMKNGLDVAHFLKAHPLVEKVLHPGLPDHPQHEVAKCQCSGYSGMVSIYIKGGQEESEAFVSNLKVFTLAESLGCVESLAEVPILMTHQSVPPEQRAKVGITDNLIRLSVGLEAIEDLTADLDQALRAAHAIKKK